MKKIKASSTTTLKIEIVYSPSLFDDDNIEKELNSQYNAQANFGKEFLCDEIRDELTDLNIESLALASIEDYCKQRIKVGCPQDVDKFKRDILKIFENLK